MHFVFSGLQSITNLQTFTVADDNAIRVQWAHDVTGDPCSNFVDYVVEYTLKNQDDCYQPTNSSVMSVTTSNTEYTITGLQPFSTYSISVSARRGGIKHGSTTETVSQTSRQLGLYQFILKLSIYLNISM